MVKSKNIALLFTIAVILFPVIYSAFTQYPCDIAGWFSGGTGKVIKIVVIISLLIITLFATGKIKKQLALPFIIPVFAIFLMIDIAIATTSTNSCLDSGFNSSPTSLAAADNATSPWGKGSCTLVDWHQSPAGVIAELILISLLGIATYFRKIKWWAALIFLVLILAFFGIPMKIWIIDLLRLNHGCGLNTYEVTLYCHPSEGWGLAKLNPGCQPALA
jgi:type IV secretory pathway VirB2 component (pilin)